MSRGCPVGATKEERKAFHDRQRAARLGALLRARSVPCADCGLVDPEIMDLDHVPGRGPKIFGLGNNMSRSWRVFMAELAKCDTVCPNCHRRRTVRRLAGV